MKPPKIAIGVLGGTFDPVHNGHIRVAEYLMKDLWLNHIQLIPNKIPPHRPKPIASAQQRLDMLHLAVQQNPQLVVNDIELQREGPSYTIDTLRALRQQNPNLPLCLIMGNDVLVGLEQWHEWEKIPELAHIVVLNRDEDPVCIPERLHKFVKKYFTGDKEDLINETAGKIFLHPMCSIEMSSSDIRQRLERKRDITYMLPMGVEEYIHQHYLYGCTPQDPLSTFE